MVLANRYFNPIRPGGGGGGGGGGGSEARMTKLTAANQKPMMPKLCDF